MKPARGILVDFIALNNHTCHRSIYVLIKFILCERSLYERMILINTLNGMSLLCTKTALCHLYSQCLFKALSHIRVVMLEECHILFWNEFGYSILLCNINLATVLLRCSPAHAVGALLFYLFGHSNSDTWMADSWSSCSFLIVGLVLVNILVFMYANVWLLVNFYNL